NHFGTFGTMPTLDNPRWERFAQAIVEGLANGDCKPYSQGRAYIAAGYTAKDQGKRGGSAECAASRLLNRVKPIIERVRELQAEANKLLARLRPSPVRPRISSLSNSAKPPSTVSISLPCGVVVSAQTFLRLRKPASRSPTVAKTFNKSRVDRAKRSRHVTISTSP